jgi:putative redox protein
MLGRGVAGGLFSIQFSTATEEATVAQLRFGQQGSGGTRLEAEMKIETTIRSIGGLQQEITIGSHRLVADEPPDNGGQDAGPSPFGLLTAALGA